MNRAELDQIAMPLCACGQLWKTSSEPVDNQRSRGRDSTSFVKDKSFTTREATVDALLEAVDLLSARLDALEDQILAFTGILDLPLSPSEALLKLRQLREQMV